MSSSSETRPGRGVRARVLREEAGHATAAALLCVDLRPKGLARLDPARVDAAVEEGRERGYREGWAAGHAEATAEVQARAAAEVAAVAARFEALLASAEAELERSLEQVARQADAVAARAGQVAGQIAEAVVGHELATRTDRAVQAVARALALVPDTGLVTLRLHPEDAAALDVASLDTHLGTHHGIAVVPDAGLDHGDCVATAGFSTVDARIQPALERARAALADDPSLDAGSCTGAADGMADGRRALP